MTAWKVTLLATQWLLLSAQSIPDGAPMPPSPIAQPRLFPSWIQETILPPKQFDHEYDGDLTVVRVTAKDVFRNCRAGMKPDRGEVLGCARSYPAEGNSKKSCVIYIMTPDALAARGYDITMSCATKSVTVWDGTTTNGLQ